VPQSTWTTFILTYTNNYLLLKHSHADIPGTDGAFESASALVERVLFEGAKPPVSQDKRLGDPEKAARKMSRRKMPLAQVDALDVAGSLFGTPTVGMSVSTRRSKLSYIKCGRTDYDLEKCCYITPKGDVAGCGFCNKVDHDAGMVSCPAGRVPMGREQSILASLLARPDWTSTVTLEGWT
jgi:hypothetical protein